jgi:hypothetical protein
MTTIDYDAWAAEMCAEVDEQALLGAEPFYQDDDNRDVVYTLRHVREVYHFARTSRPSDPRVTKLFRPLLQSSSPIEMEIVDGQPIERAYSEALYHVLECYPSEKGSCRAWLTLALLEVRDG